MRVLQTSKAFTVEVPAGAYMLGDPCYSIPNEDWNELLVSCGAFQYKPIGELRGIKVLAFNTAYGDGCYCDQEGNEYGVDAGLIGLVPCRLATKHAGGARRLVFDQDFICKTDGQGRLIFGTIHIKTNDS